MGTQLPPPQQGGRAPNFWPTAGWIKIALGMEMGLGPGHIVLDGDPVSPPKKGTQLPPISAHVYCRQMAGWIKMPLGTEVGLGPGDAVLDGDPAPPKRGTALPPIFSPCLLWPNGWMGQDATWYRGRLRPMPHCVRRGPSSPRERGTTAPLFSAHVYCDNGRPSQLLLSSC